MAMSFKEIMPLDLVRGDFIILVIGPTGSGKSNFIQQLLAGRPKPQTLKSDTSEIKAFRIFNPRVNSPISSLVVVDTPGFDDTKRHDYVVLDMAAEWIRKSYFDGFPVAGLVYCHRITDNRTSGTPKPNSRMFSKLTGLATFEKVTLLQTMWDLVSPQVGQRRDEELRGDLWKPLIEPTKGPARVEKFRNSMDDAWAVVSRSVEVHIDTDPRLVVQDEMTSAREQVAGAPASKELYTRYEGLLRQQRQRLRELRSEEITPDTKTRVEREIQELDEQLEKTFQEICKLRMPFFRKITSLFKGSSKARHIVIPEARV